jgi:hypothetical protein
MQRLGRGHCLVESTRLDRGSLSPLLLQKGEKINVAVKTCKKDCTLDNKEKFMSEAGRHPLWRAEIPHPSEMGGPKVWKGR